MSDNYNYDVTLSFAGEDREYVGRVASALESLGIRVFYDEFEQVTLWGKDLYEYLDSIYRKQAKYCVIFISKNYIERAWTLLERKSAQERALKENREYILPARFDDTEIPGIQSTIAYIDLKKYAPEEFAAIIAEKVGLSMAKPSRSLVVERDRLGITPSREEVKATLVSCVQATLAKYWDNVNGGFFHSIVLSKREPYRVFDDSKRLEDNSLMSWSLLKASHFLPDDLARQAIGSAIKCLDRLHRSLAIGDDALCISTDRTWHNASREVQSEDIGAFCIASIEAYNMTKCPRHLKRVLRLSEVTEHLFWDDNLGAFRWRAFWDDTKKDFVRLDSRIKWANTFNIIAYALACKYLSGKLTEKVAYNYKQRVIRLLEYFLDDEPVSREKSRNRLGAERKMCLFPNAVYLYALQKGYEATGHRKAIMEFGGGTLDVVSWMLEMEDPVQGGLFNFERKHHSALLKPKNLVAIAASLFSLNEWLLANEQSALQVKALIDRIMAQFLTRGFLESGIVGHFTSEKWEPLTMETVLPSQAWSILALDSFLRRSEMLNEVVLSQSVNFQ